VLRLIRYREPALYQKQAMSGQAVSQGHEVARRDLAFEFALNAFRLKNGFALSDFSVRTGLPLSAIEAPLAQAQNKGLIEQVGQRVLPTERGFDFLNDLMELFLPPEGKTAVTPGATAQTLVFKPNQ
jgi:oxygen-independent coproporphyrinogen-3 oxidase